MPLEASVLLASTIFILGIIPGPGVLLVVSRTISGGFLAGAWTIAGMVCADIIFLLVVVCSLQAIATVLDSAFIFIQNLGAAYLIWLGTITWKSPHATLDVSKTSSFKPQSLSSLWLTGLMVTLSNPKAVLFYLSFLPIIVDITSLSLKDIGLMGLIICTTIGGIMFFYVMIVVKAKNKMRPLSNNRIVQRVAGSMIIATGLILLTRGYF